MFALLLYIGEQIFMVVNGYSINLALKHGIDRFGGVSDGECSETHGFVSHRHTSWRITRRMRPRMKRFAR